MTRWISVLVLLVACGGDDGDGGSGVDGGNTNGNKLACAAVTYCSTWDSNDEEDLTPPVERGGTIGDGIYRLERGSFSTDLLQFQGNQVNRIGNSFDNDSGTYTTTDGKISFAYTSRCDAEGPDDYTSEWNDRPYYANGNTLLIGMADSNQGVVWYEYKKLTVDQICEASADVSCNVSNCSCAVVTNGFGTVENGVKYCSAN